MKRKDIIKTIDIAGQLMDSFGGAAAKNVETDEYTADIVTEEEIRAMQTTLHVCKKLLSKDLDSCDPLKLVSNLITLHAVLKLEGIKGEDGEADEEITEGDAND